MLLWGLGVTWWHTSVRSIGKVVGVGRELLLILLLFVFLEIDVVGEMVV